MMECLDPCENSQPPVFVCENLRAEWIIDAPKMPRIKTNDGEIMGFGNRNLCADCLIKTIEWFVRLGLEFNVKPHAQHDRKIKMK